MSNDQQHSSFEDLTPGEALNRLSSDSQQGLSSKEASDRLDQYGENVIEEERQNPILTFFSHFWGPIPWMIEVAVVLSAVAQRWEDLGVISTMLLINGGVSFWHERRAGNAIEALKERLAPQARVVRNGAEETIPARELVPGDLVILRMGDIVPADAKLLQDQYLSADESALTGESLPVDKESGELVFSGTTVSLGEARVLVTATGRDTRFATTVELVETAGAGSHFQRAVLRIGYFLIGATAVLVAIIVATTIARGDPWTDVLLFAMVLTIAGIPQALPAVLSVTMTIGANRLAEMEAIVSYLDAMEEMAGLEILCADKTGTLTLNKLELQDPVVLDAEDEHDLLVAAALTCRDDTEDPIDRAVLGGMDELDELEDYEISDFRPFDPTRKRAEADVSRNGNSFTVAKGAPQVILDLVDPSGKKRKEIREEVDRLGEEGFRALGVARQANGKWNYLGILPLLDPPREDSAEVIRQAQEHRIDIRMVTGDHAAIARQVAGQVGLSDDIKSASELFVEEESTEEIDEETLQLAGFAEVTPEHKYRLVQAFQRRDRIVGMTGDGVNDAPALKQANVGIAVSGATDAARAAAALVLTAPGLGVITRAVEEARRIFERMTGYATFRIAESMRVVLFVSLSILFFDFYPVTPIMIVLLAILNDIPIMTIAWDNVTTSPRPVRWDMRRVLSISTVLGIGGVISSFVLFWYLREWTDLQTEAIQTMIFLKLLVAGHLTIFLTRNIGAIWSKPWPNLYLFSALEATQIIGTLAAVYGWLVHPIGWTYAGAVWGYALVWWLLLSGAKILTYKALRQTLGEESVIQA